MHTNKETKSATEPFLHRYERWTNTDARNWCYSRHRSWCHRDSSLADLRFAVLLLQEQMASTEISPAPVYEGLDARTRPTSTTRIEHMIPSAIWDEDATTNSCMVHVEDSKAFVAQDGKPDLRL